MYSKRWDERVREGQRRIGRVTDGEDRVRWKGIGAKSE